MTAAPLKCIDQDTAQHLADLFKTLGDPTRIKILSLLAAAEELRVLRSARLVKFRRDGKEVLYSIDDDHVLKLLSQGLEHVQHA